MFFFVQFYFLSYFCNGNDGLSSKLVDSLCEYEEDVFAEEKALLMSFGAAFAFL